MNRRLIIIIGIVLIILGIAGFFLKSRLIPSQAGILIETTPQATVYIDDQEVGTTPYDAVRTPGEITVRLVPIATTESLAPWGTKVTLTEGIKTVIRRDFGPTEFESAGEILSFEKVAGSSAQMAFVSRPDAASINIDGEGKGFTPISLDTIDIGDHKILVTQTGYKDRSIDARAEAGYKLTVVAMLAQLPQQSTEATGSADEATDSASPQEKTTQVQILDTPTGFLRVRAEPSTSASESAQVKPGDKFTLVEENKKGDWYKIEYQKGKQGWITAQYAKKIKEE